MKKLFLSLVAAIVAATATHAQSSLVATLNHEGTVSVYYGTESLSQALSAATHGDEITLSAGRFSAVDITKAVTIRGAGCQEDTVRMTHPTIIMDDFTINIPDSVKQKLTMEGVYCSGDIQFSNTLKNAMFQKCKLEQLTNSGSTQSPCNIYNMTFANCIVAYLTMSTAYNKGVKHIYCINSAIGFPCNDENTGCWMEFTNCVVYGRNQADNSYYGLYNSTFHNCFFYNSSSSYPFVLHSSNYVYNCVGSSSDIFKKTYGSSNKVNADLANGSNAKMFKSGTFYELTDEAKAQYVGDDGTEVGIYGGSMPYDPTPTNPQITKFDVNASTSNGKLTVTLDVE